MSDDSDSSDAMAIFTFIVCLAIIGLERKSCRPLECSQLTIGGLYPVQLAVTLYRNWRGMRKAGHSNSVDLQLIIRILVFGVYILFGMV